MSRMRKNISNSTRNALLVVLVLILTTTYQSAVNPPYDLVQATLRQKNNLQDGITKDAWGPYSPPDDYGSNPFDNKDAGGVDSLLDNLGNDLNDVIKVDVDPVALSFSIFNAVDFLVTLLVTLFILPWVPYGQLLHVLLLLVFIFFVASMGLSLALTTSVIGIGVLCSFVVITIILGIFIVINKARSRKVYEECIKEVGDRVRLHRHENDDTKKK